MSLFRSFLLFALFSVFPASGMFAQVKRNPQPSPTPPAEEPSDGNQSDETLKVETNLVTVPVLASDRNDLYVPDLRKEEFLIKDDGVPQQVAFFATTTAPFHVVLMIDTSASTQQKLIQIQRAATNFTEQLQSDDRVKVISFDDAVRDLGDFTSDRAQLDRAIAQTRPGKGTKLYDAVTLAINSLQQIQGRKAIVLFTDGVDYHSDTSTYDGNRKAIQESGIIVYTIRFDTRVETERLARAQAQQSGGAPVDLSSILGAPARGTTAPTFPGGERVPGSTGSGTRNVSVLPTLRLPDRQQPDNPDPNNPFPDTTRGRQSRFPRTDDRNSQGTSIPRDTRQDESISAMLDLLYKTADDYLDEMAVQSGGQMLRADTLMDLPGAFATIANELRTQYSLGYYPTNHERDGKYHNIKVNTTRKDVVIRSRPGYRAPSGKAPGRFPHGKQPGE
jgi:von Willebrand factor type A domain